MTVSHWEVFEPQFKTIIRERDFGDDPAHDFAHFSRVVATAKKLGYEEQADFNILVPASWFHDLVNVPKNDPRRSHASRLSAQEAQKILIEMKYPPAQDSEKLKAILHAIEAHSYSAQIEPKTLEATILQDADRLDGLGAIGIARCFSVGGLLRRSLYHSEDPFGENRSLDDLKYTIDHFFVKLFKTVETLKTSSGRKEGEMRMAFMKGYLSELSREF